LEASAGSRALLANPGVLLAREHASACRGQEGTAGVLYKASPLMNSEGEY
jgi:hypothetical protein